MPCLGWWLCSHCPVRPVDEIQVDEGTPCAMPVIAEGEVSDGLVSRSGLCQGNKRQGRAVKANPSTSAVKKVSMTQASWETGSASMQVGERRFQTQEASASLSVGCAGAVASQAPAQP